MNGQVPVVVFPFAAGGWSFSLEATTSFRESGNSDKKTARKLFPVAFQKQRARDCRAVPDQDADSDNNAMLVLM